MGIAPPGGNAFDFSNLDIPGSLRGAILYKGAGGVWTYLPAGSLGEVLQTQGAGADPIWGPSSGSILSGRTIWVDATNGNDGTGASGRQDLPFLTVAAAIAASASGDLIRLYPGTYAESGLTLPAGVSITGSGWALTTLGVAGAGADILTFAGDSVVSGLTVQVPSGGFSGLVHSAGTGGVYGCNFAGDGGAGVGSGVSKNGTGKLIGGNLRFEIGGMANGLRVNAGVMALDDVHFPTTSAQIGNALLVDGTGRFQGQGFNVGNPQITDAIEMGGTGTALVFSPNIFNCTNAVHIAADGITFTSTGGKIDAAALTVLVDGGLTGTGTTVEALATVLSPLFSFPPAAAGNTNFVLNFQQLQTNVREARQRIIGADLALGFPELGSGLFVGKGASYGDGMKVVTTDGTEVMIGSVVTGGNQTDETAAAQSLTGSTFSFQGLGVNHAIYFASQRRDPAGTALKHWGGLARQVTAGVGGSYVVEVWDGAAWSEVGVLSVGENTGYVYGSALFLRSGTLEDIRYGIDNGTTWALATVDGVSAYWVRIRVATLLTTAPVWERWQLVESTLHINERGQITADGTAQWLQTLVGAGNVFASGGTTTDGTATVGTGGGTWVHDLDNAKLNQSNDVVSTQFVIPAGVNTAFPITLRLFYEFAQYNAAPTLEGRILGVERQGVHVADPAGSDVPIPRSEANTNALTAKAGQVASVSPVATSTGKILSLEFGPYDISDLYAGDLVLFQLDMTADGGGGGAATDVQVWAIEVEGVTYTPGALI